MKSIIGAFVVAMLMASLVLPSLVLAGAEGTSATGAYKFVLEDGVTRMVEFSAREGAEGQTIGEMTFSDPSAIPVENPDEQDRVITEGVLVKARFDCLQVNENRAVIGGEIYESNVFSSVGKRVLLVIEDNGLERDRITWGIFQQPPTGWVPKDAERDDDEGAKLKWIATDFERRDDVGIPSDLSKVVSCKSFPLEAFEFPEIKSAGGDLQVQRR